MGRHTFFSTFVKALFSTPLLLTAGFPFSGLFLFPSGHPVPFVFFFSPLLSEVAHVVFSGKVRAVLREPAALFFLRYVFPFLVAFSDVFWAGYLKKQAFLFLASVQTLFCPLSGSVGDESRLPPFAFPLCSQFSDLC